MVTMSRSAETPRDHVDRFLESIREELPDLDLTVEGIVDRINGLSRRIKRLMDETLTERDLTWGEWKVLGLLRRSPEHRRSPGYLAVHAELSSGAMTNRLDNLEKRGLIKRLPDPNDRRGVQVELTDAGSKAYEESTAAQAAKEGLIASALNEKEKDELNNLLRRLMLAAEQVQSPHYPGDDEIPTG
jgi:DNA-binding MarR family transcriptional regulator